MANRAETAYLSVRDGELSNAVRLVNLWRRKVATHLFWGGSKPGCSDGLCVGIIESHNFFVLRPILVKLHIQTRLIKSFPTTFQTWWCSEEKLHFTPVYNLRQLKRDEALIPPLQRVVGFQARYGYETARRSGGGPNLKSMGLLVEEK